MRPEPLWPEAQALLARLEDEPERAQQLRDALLGTAFRASIFCDHTRPITAPQPERVTSLRAAFRCDAVERHQARPGVSFRLPTGATLRTDDPLIAHALERLAACWPHSLAFDTLCAQSCAALEAARWRTQTATARRALAEALLRFYALDAVALSSSEPPFARTAGARPRVGALARRQAARGPQVTNRVHQRVTLPPVVRLIAIACDGERDRAALRRELCDRMRRGELRLPAPEAGTQARSAEALLEQVVAEGVAWLARHALLVEDADGAALRA